MKENQSRHPGQLNIDVVQRIKMKHAMQQWAGIIVLSPLLVGSFFLAYLNAGQLGDGTAVLPGWAFHLGLAWPVVLLAIAVFSATRYMATRRSDLQILMHIAGLSVGAATVSFIIGSALAASVTPTAAGPVIPYFFHACTVFIGFAGVVLFWFQPSQDARVSKGVDGGAELWSNNER